MNSAKAEDYQTSLDLYKTQRELTNSSLQKLFNLLCTKIHERFDKINSAYKFFAGMSTKKISFNDFVMGIENMRLKLTTKEISEMF